MPSRTSRSEQDPRRSKREDDKDKKKKEEPNINDLAENDLDMEIDFEKLVQKEYGKLQRQYRIMEDVRHAALAGAGDHNPPNHNSSPNRDHPFLIP